MSDSVATKKVSKSGLIREYLTNSKDKSPSKIAEMLEKEKGIKVTPTYVSVIKSKMKSKSASKTKTKVKAKTRSKTKVKANRSRKAKAENSLDLLISAKDFIEKVGSADNAKKLIDVFNKHFS